jgi:hypothetical protein
LEAQGRKSEIGVGDSRFFLAAVIWMFLEKFCAIHGGKSFSTFFFAQSLMQMAGF